MGEDEITFYAKQCHAATWQMLVNIPGTGILKEKGTSLIGRQMHWHFSGNGILGSTILNGRPCSSRTRWRTEILPPQPANAHALSRAF